MCMCGPFEQTILYSNDLVSTQIMSERKRLSTESTAFSFLIHSSFLNFVKSLLLFSLFFSFYDPVYFFMISSSKILCGFTTLLQNTYPYQVAILKNRPLFFLPVPSLTMSVCDSHAQWATVHCWLGDERWTETSHTPLAYSLPPSLVSLSVLSSLSCCRPCWAVIWQMLKTLFFLFLLCFSSSVSARVCVHVHVNRLPPAACECFGQHATCDHAYTWCIYTLFVSLSHQYAAEVKAGCDDPAMAGQLAVAYLLVWMITH